ncbi:putative berberine/berberine, FAD-binding domain, PCMH-type, FAD-binding, type PCMH, subdomain 1 [Helianthus annuus]|nr:putative berberine/berberine, FAD-binding domain, PCMH-type, FAD-binding, type PCMH, subdomain 1 [Helianthus annuus]KAJ0925485.1 putative berberine/berberine, FAD-binding domain, PCMH-type, FAD-binding, type PCMH, subdomain 1 [Helianthus annuus]
MSVSAPSFVYEHEHEHEHEKRFVMSLTRLGVHNFSTRSNSSNDSSSVYHQLLNLSIQNLRFVDSSLPKPVVIVFPETKEQLANTVICARESSLEIRVRCGGHSYEGTSSVAMDGCPFVVIDLTRLDRVSVDVDSGTAWVEGGATLGQTYYTISESTSVHGFSAGSCPTVGVGGHISGGGFGLLSRKYGLAADNVVDAVLVTADGKLLNRAAMGEDIFWAIRGGGGGVWGIVYAWNIKLSSVPDTVTCFIVSRSGTKEQVADMIDKWQHVAPTLPDDFYMSSFVGAGLPERKDKPGLSATFKGLYLGPKAKALLIMNQNFHELKIVENDCKEMSWIESVLYFSGFGDQSSVSDLKNRFLQDKLYYKAKSDFVRKSIPRLGLTIMLDILEKQSKGYVILDPYGGMMESISSDSIPFPHRKGNLFTIQYLVEWKETDNDKTDDYIAWIRGFHGSMTPYVAQDPRAAYVNYMDVDLGVMNWTKNGVESNHVVEMGREWGEKYFGNNYDRLVKAKTEIDPFNVFRHQQSIPPMSLEYKNSKGSRLSE